jgi:hypothetical protein
MADKAGLLCYDYIKQCDTVCEDEWLCWKVVGDGNRRKYGVKGLSSAHLEGND